MMQPKVILNSIGVIEYTQRGDEHITDCIFCNETKKNLEINLKKGVFHCWVCDEKGSILSLLSSVNDISINDAQKILDSQDYDYDYVLDDVIEQLKSLEDSKPHIYEYKIYLRNSRYEYWANRNIDRKTVKKFKLGMDTYNKRIVIPLFKNKRCIGLIKRAINKSILPKYKNTKGFIRNRYIYPYDMIDKNKNYVMLCEGAIDAINLNRLGFNAASSLGINVSDFQRNYLVTNFENIILALDNDAPGMYKTNDLKDELGDYCNVYKLKYKNRDPAEIKNKKDLEIIKLS